MGIENHFLSYCPFCGRTLLFLEERIPLVKSCPVCGAPIAFEAFIDLEKDELGYKIVPSLEGESFQKDGFTVENGVLLRYEGGEKSIKTPSGVLAIAPEAFKDNKHLSSVTLSEGLLYIGNEAFSGCDGIKEVRLPESLITIGSSAFAYCRRLSAITIPKGLRAAGGGTFHGCDYLTELLFPMDMEYLGGAPHTFCKNLRVANVPHCVESLGCSWFAYNDKLEVLYVGRKLSSLSCPSECLRELHLSDPCGWMLYGPINTGKDVPISEKELSTPKAAASYLKKLKREGRTMFRPPILTESYWLIL